MLALGEQSYLSAQAVSVSAEGISCGATRDCLDKSCSPQLSVVARDGPNWKNRS